MRFSQFQLPPPRKWQDFESLCRDLWSQIWNDCNALKHGRSGQAQSGVDISGHDGQGKCVGVQCKVMDRLSALTERELLEEVKRARTFNPPLKQLVVATTGKKDTKIEKCAREITEKHQADGLFGVHVLGWIDILERLDAHPEIGYRYFADLVDPSYKERSLILPHSGVIFGQGWAEEQDQPPHWLQERLRPILLRATERILGIISPDNREAWNCRFVTLRENAQVATYLAQAQKKSAFWSEVDHRTSWLNNHKSMSEAKLSLDKRETIRVYFTPIMLGTAAILFYLRDYLGLNISLEHDFPNALVVVEEIKNLSFQGSRWARVPHACVVGDGPATGLYRIVKEPFYTYCMPLPPSEHRICTPPSARLLEPSRSAEIYFTVAPDLLSTPKMHVERLRQEGKIAGSLKPIGSAAEALYVIRKGDKNCIVSTWTPCWELYSNLNMCNILGSAYDDQFNVFLYLEKGFSQEPRAAYFEAAIRYAWGQLWVSHEERCRALNFMLSEKSYVYNLLRFCGLRDEDLLKASESTDRT